MVRKRGQVRRGFGKLRQLASGNWQASYIGPDGARHNAPHTYAAKTDAELWLGSERVYTERISPDEWLSPAQRRKALERDATPLREYAARWLTRTMKPSYRAKSDQLLRLHILPHLGDLPIVDIDLARVKNWWNHDLNHSHERTCDLAYSLLRTIMYAAVEDGLISDNPCKVKGAGKPSRKRSIEPLTPAQVQAIADSFPEEWALGVMLGTWCAQRSGEVRELRRSDIDTDTGMIHVSRAVARAGSVLVVGDTKTDAGDRKLMVPRVLLPMVRRHLDAYAQPGPNGLLFWDRETGGTVHDNKWRRAFVRACKAAGVTGYTFHDLRHTGLTYAAVAGATTKELMRMAGHTTATMAMRYQEVAVDHMGEVVAGLGGMIRAGRRGKSVRPRRPSK